MLLKDLPEKLQDFAILRMVEENIKTNIEEEDHVSDLFIFLFTDECEEWIQLNWRHNLEPMYTKYPELR